MIRLSMTVLVALISAYVGLHVIFSLVNEPTAILTYVKIAYAVIVVGSGMLILHWQWTSRRIGVTERWAIFIGGLGMIEIGTANMVWTAHLGLVTGDWEFYGFVGGALISLLGAVAATWLAMVDTNRDPQLTA